MDGRKTVKISETFQEHLKCFFEYGVEYFGKEQTKKYIHYIYNLISDLEKWYTLYPECRYLKTERRIYRNIILDSYFIIYRIQPDCVEVLDIIRTESSIRKIRGVRKIKP